MGGGLIQRRWNPDKYEARTSFGLGRLLRGRGTRALQREIDGDRHLRRHVNNRLLEKFEDEGGDVDDDQSFLEWLLEHADEIIAFISKIIALFSGGGVAPVVTQTRRAAKPKAARPRRRAKRKGKKGEPSLT
jgi:hypothetical protein